MPERQLTKPEIDANVLKATAEAEKATAEAKKFLSEARIAEMLEQVQQVALAKTLEERKIELSSNYFHHTYDFTSEVGYTSMRNCLAQLRIWERNDPGCDIEIIFSSPGGSIIDGMALFDYIQKLRRAGHKVTTGALGMVASMAGILLQAGNRRWMGAEAYLLVHELQAGAIGKIGELEDEMKLLHMMSSRILDIFASRTKLSKKQLEARWKRTDWWLDSRTALRDGFVDEVK